jgi:Kef-type K+ transport system membrane component KefB
MMAGLAFSRDHEAVHTNTRIKMLYDFFVPFFFINIGLQIDPGVVTESLWLAAPLLLAAIAGKLIGVGLPILFRSGYRDALLLGFSMIPRAEITMLIVFQAGMLNNSLISPELYSAMVIVVVLSSVASPVVLRKLIA